MKFILLCFISYTLAFQVYESCIAKSDIKTVWKKIGDFSNLSWMNPEIKIMIDYPIPGFLPRRTFRFGPQVVKEQMISARNETNSNFVKYEFEKDFEAFKVDNYVAKLSVQRSTVDKISFVIWEAQFDVRKNEEEEAEKIKTLFKTTIEAVSKMDFNE